MKLKKVKFKNLSHKKQKKLMKTVDQLKPIDDPMAQKMLEGEGVPQEVLRIVLEKPGLNIVSSEPQKYLRNLGKARSVILDDLCFDEEMNWYDLEVQKSDDEDHPKRLRYNISNMDTYMVEKGTEFNQMKKSTAVMLTKKNFLYHQGFAQINQTTYESECCLKDTGTGLSVGVRMVFVNAEGEDDTPAAKLMRFMVNGEGEGDFPLLRERYRYFTEENKGRRTMCELIENLIREENAENHKEVQKGCKEG